MTGGTYNVMDLFAGIVLVFAVSITAGVFAMGYQFKIIKRIVRSITIEMVNIVTRWDLSMMEFPNIAMNQCSVPIGLAVISGISQGVLKPVEYNKRQWLRSGSEFITPTFKHLMHGLPGNAERLTYISKAITLLV